MVQYKSDLLLLFPPTWGLLDCTMSHTVYSTGSLLCYVMFVTKYLWPLKHSFGATSEGRQRGGVTPRIHIALIFFFLLSPLPPFFVFVLVVRFAWLIQICCRFWHILLYLSSFLSLSLCLRLSFACLSACLSVCLSCPKTLRFLSQNTSVLSSFLRLLAGIFCPVLPHHAQQN